MSEFLNIDDPVWTRVLRRCDHDVYHLPAYVALEAEWNGGVPTAFLYVYGNDGMLIPLIERPLPSGQPGADMVTPYGYSPPVFTRDASPGFRVRALRAYQSTARASGVVTTFFRLHPLLMPKLDAFEPDRAARWTSEERGVTLTMPLKGDAEAFAAGMARGHRAGISRLRAAGCSFAIDSEAVWTAFPEIYRFTMEKVGAAAGYFYDHAYIERFRTTLADHVHCAGIVDPDGTVMCAGLFTRVNGLLQYHLSGTADGFAKQAPMKLLLAGMRDWAREQGVRHFHLGGGLGGRRDSLYEFKRQFGGTELPFRTVSAVHDLEAFAAECDQWTSRAGLPALPDTGFFPPYAVALPEMEDAPR